MPGCKFVKFFIAWIRASEAQPGKKTESPETAGSIATIWTGIEYKGGRDYWYKAHQVRDNIKMDIGYGGLFGHKYG